MSSEKATDKNQQEEILHTESHKKSKRSNGENKKLKDKIKNLETEKSDLNDKYVRLVAEFDNYKKRTDKEYLALIHNANEKLITDLLPILDDLERLLKHLNDDNNSGGREGIVGTDLGIYLNQI